MATALQKQLAVIAANSTHQLDLKAQKQRHSKSLLFEPRDAAAQSFDTIFQICYEGFEELCMLDSRFTPFAQNLFSEQSKDEDRTQMTAKENEELDKILQTFLGLICGRLLLKPAMSAVEWLVRRFRVQEYNTEWTLLTFLPYHGSHIFPTLMSILPEELPPTFRFLNPYVASLQSPPRHAILSAAIGNQAFFSAFSQYVLSVSRSNHHSTVLLGFWASITAQAVNGMIDSTRSGRDSIRKQREEDLLLRVLPVLQSAISIKGVQELYLGSCMIITILATKAALEDNVLDAMMEVVAAGWNEETMTEGITCLAVLAEEKQNIAQPQRVTKALLKSIDAQDRLRELSTQHRVSKLILITAVGIMDRTSQLSDVDDVRNLAAVVGTGLLTEQHLVILLEHLFPIAQRLKSNGLSTDSWKTLWGFLAKIADQEGYSEVLSRVVQTTGVSLTSLDLSDLGSTQNIEAEADAMAIDLVRDEPPSDQFRATLQALPQVDNVSLWAPEKDDTFRRYLRAFQEALPSAESLDRLLCQNYLCKSRAADRPTCLSFAARAWTSDTAQAAKLKALSLSTDAIQDQEGIDFQALLPYALSALADASQRTRKAAAELCIAMSKAYGQTPKDARIWSAKNAYGGATSNVQWQSSDDAHKVIKFALLPGLENCILDAGNVARLLTDSLNTDSVKQLKKSARQHACLTLASHAESTPVLRVRLFLLGVLNSIGKTANEARTKHLLPLAKHWTGMDPAAAQKACSAEDVDLSAMDRGCVGILSHRTHDELSLLQNFASGEASKRSAVSDFAFERIRHIWPTLGDDARLKLAEFLLEHALATTQSDTSSRVASNALNTLRNVPFSAPVIVHMIENLPKASDCQDQEPAAKKRRTSGGQGNSANRPVDQARLQGAIRRTTLVLELIEGSKPEKHPQILKGLFHLLSELHHYRTLTASELVYLQGILLDCLNSVVAGIQQAGIADIDRSVIRTDLIVECVRTTSSSQIHNTALLLMSSLAFWTPELLLHSVMPLFTFMSSTLLRQHDDFSAHVTDQTVAQIVPPLAASLKKKGKDLVTGASELLLSFTTAFEHIPLHRRLGLFQHLVETLGADETLFAVIAMLFERYASNDAVSAFTSDLVNHFSTRTALITATQYLDLVFDALKPKRKLADILLGFGDKDGEAREDAIDDLLDGLAGLLESQNLRDRLATQPTDEQGAECVRAAYSLLLEKTMQLTRDLSSNANLKDSANQVLASVLGLMPTSDFIDSSARLMQTGSHETRQQVFRSLEARVVQARCGDKEAQSVFVDVLPNCGVFIATSQPVATRHAAISCIDQICEKFGKTDTDAVLDAAKIVAGDAGLGSADQSLQVISVLCLASMVEVLRDGAVAFLPSVLDLSLPYMSRTLDAEQPNEQLLSAGFSLLGSIMDNVAWMLSASYLEAALKLAATMARTGHAHLSQVFVELVATKVSPQELFAAIEGIWSHVLSDDVTATGSLLAVLRGEIAHNTKSTVTKNASSLFDILLRAFDLRRETAVSAENDDDNDDVDELFTTVDRLALDMTLKLNDATFRPFFVRLVEWTANLPKNDSQGRVLRATSLFSFTFLLFEQLKSIVTSYASFILDSVVEVLKADGTRDSRSQVLLDLCLQTLSSSFQNDQDDFWQAPSHFDAVAEPLINQLVKSKATPATVKVIPTITELAAASSSPEHLKTINNRLMQLMKHQDAAVRLAAVQCERSITEKLTFDWLALLPEMLPAISEAQEDDSEDVEREVLKWVRQIEEITGESLEGMLA